MTDEGIKELAPLTKLFSLTFNRTKVTDAGPKEFAPLKNLFIVDVTGTKVTDAGAKELQKVLPGCKVLK